MISISHSPNSNSKQQLRALSLLFPWNWSKWQQGKEQTLLKEVLSDYHEQADIHLFKNGRSALYAALKAVGVSNGDEVIIQAYTCIVVPNSVIWAGAKPIYVDIDPSYNLDPEKLKQAITNKTKAIIVQHTFGYPANLKKIQAIAKEYNLRIIEDCAHSLGAMYNKQRIGTFGDIAILSFGRDKMISSVTGGATVTKDKDLAKKLDALLKGTPSVSTKSIRQNLFHPLLVPWMTKLMNPTKIGQALMILSQKLGLLSKVYRKDEPNGKQPEQLIQPLPNAMASLAYGQFLWIEENLRKRAKHAFAYQEFCSNNGIAAQEIQINSQPSYLRFTIEHSQAKEVRKSLMKNGFLIDNWYTEVVMPRPDKWETIYYTPGSCPKSEALAHKNINLPTHPKLTGKQRSKLLKLLKNHYE